VANGKPGVAKGVATRTGIPNKATADARAAIKSFVEKNTPRMQKWLDSIADGIPRLDKDGNQIYDKDGLPMWEVRPNPDRAFSMVNSVLEYHVPKLAKQELTGQLNADVTVKIVQFGKPDA
jgi:hypothetical protein